MFVTKEFHFAAAHHLTKYYGKCERPHGHSYRLFVTVEGPVSKNGLVVDFVLLKKVIEQEVISKLDHYDLNALFKNPSAEHISMWIWDRLKPLGKLLARAQRELLTSSQFTKGLQGKGQFLPEHELSKVKLFEVKLYEEETSSVTYRGKTKP